MEKFKHIVMTGLFVGLCASSQSHAQEPLKIGVVTPLSGTYAGIGQPVRWG